MSKILKIETDKNPLSYRSGETMSFSVGAFDENGDAIAQKIAYRLTGDDGKFFEGITDVDAKNGAVITTLCDRPGFVHLMIKAINEDFSLSGDYCVYDAGAGADVEDIPYHGHIPDDYDRYWADIRRAVNDFDMQVLDLVPYYTGVPEDTLCFDFKISTPLSAGKASGLVTYPKKPGKYPMKIYYQGYGIAGCGVPEIEKDTICMIVNAHGVENGFSMEAIIQKYAYLNDYGFEEDKNAAPETSYWQGVIVRDLVAVRYAKTLPMWNGKDLTAIGGSQGAFQSTLVAANDAAVSHLHILIPWFCDLRAEENGYQTGWRPKPARGLEYFDTVAAMTRVTCPVEIEAGLGDYVCPPCTTAALYNAAQAPVSITYTQCEIHGFTPDNQKSFRLEKNR